MTQEEMKQVIAKAIRYELSITAKYAELQGFLTEPELHSRLSALEQTTRNHLYLLDRMQQRLREGGLS